MSPKIYFKKFLSNQSSKGTRYTNFQKQVSTFKNRVLLPFSHNYGCSFSIIFISALSFLCSTNTGHIYKCLLGKYRERFFLPELHIYAIHAEHCFAGRNLCMKQCWIPLVCRLGIFQLIWVSPATSVSASLELSFLDDLSLFKKESSLLFLISAQHCFLFVRWIVSPEFTIFNKHIIDKMLSSTL